MYISISRIPWTVFGQRTIEQILINERFCFISNSIKIPLKCSVKFCCTVNYNTKKLKKKDLGKKDQNNIFIKVIFTKIYIYNSKALLSFIYEASFHHIIMSIKNCLYMHVLSILSFSWIWNLHTVYKLTERSKNVSGGGNFKGR